MEGEMAVDGTGTGPGADGAVTVGLDVAEHRLSWNGRSGTLRVVVMTPDGLSEVSVTVGAEAAMRVVAGEPVRVDVTVGGE